MLRVSFPFCSRAYESISAERQPIQSSTPARQIARWVATTFSPARGGDGADKPPSPPCSKGSWLTEAIHIDAGVDKSLFGAFHAGEIEKSIRLSHVTPARTPSADRRRRHRASDGKRLGGHRDAPRFPSQPPSDARTKGRMTSFDDGDVTSSCAVCTSPISFSRVSVRSLLVAVIVVVNTNTSAIDRLERCVCAMSRHRPLLHQEPVRMNVDVQIINHNQEHS